jgi:hypothetical protein
VSELIYRLIGSPSLRLGQPGVEFGFAMNIAPWGWALIALGAATFGMLAYRRTEGSFAGRVALGALRAVLLLLIAVLLAGPRLIKPNETEEKDWVLVLSDRSASMSIADVAGTGGAKRITRDAQLKAALAKAEPVFKTLAAERVVVHLGFDAAAYDLPELGEAAGRRTDLNRAIEQALRRGAARPISGVVLLTDGRTNGGSDEPTRALLRRLETEKIPIFTVPLGSPVPSADLAVRRASAPRYAFVKDSVPVDVELQRTGPATAAGETSTVELVDTATGVVLDTRTITWTAPADRPVNAGDPVEQTQRVTLTTEPASAGATKWTVRVRPTAAGAGAGQQTTDMVDDNNTAEMTIDLVDRPLRIAYFDGYPRWEYRYLKNLLVREHSASAAVMLLAPGKRYIQEGSVILDALPHTIEEWNAFDVIIMGDVWPGVFTNEQLTQLKERVSAGGAGLIWIGGEGSTPGAYRSTPLNELLPFTLAENLSAANSSGLDTFDDGVTISPTPAADRLGVLRLSDVPNNTPTAAGGPMANAWFPPLLSDPNTGWASLFWVQKIDPAILKPTTEVLAIATPEGASPSSGRPALMTMRYGAGRVIYVATDEIWRWRYGRGEMYPERFWIQLVRLLGRESVARSGRPAILEATPDHALVEQTVRVQITLLDQSLADSAPASLRVKIKREGAIDAAAHEPAGEKDAGVVELTLTPETAMDSTPGKKAGARVYAATWIPTDSGRYRATTDDPTLTSLATGTAAEDLTARIDVWQSDDELRRPQTDHALLARLSETTGGKVLQPDQLGDLPRLLPNRKLKLAGEPEIHTLWDTPAALLMAVLLLTAEWVGRRLLRLA